MKNISSYFLIVAFLAFLCLVCGCKPDSTGRAVILPPDIKSQQVKDFLPKNYYLDSTDYDTVYLFQDEKGVQNKLTCIGIGRGSNEESKKINHYLFQFQDTLNHIKLWYEIFFGVKNTESGSCDALVVTTIFATQPDRHQQAYGGASVCISDEKIQPSSDTEYFLERNIMNKSFKHIYCSKGQIGQTNDSTKIDYETCIEAGKGIVAYSVNGRFYVCE